MALLEQLPDRYAKRFGEPLDDRDCRVPRAALDITDVGPVDAGHVGERFLAPAVSFAQFAQVGAEAVPNVHGSPQTRLSTIDLQTIGDIHVDFGRGRSGSRRH